MRESAGQAPQRSRSAVLDYDGDIMRIGVVEEKPRPLVQHVGVDPVGLEQRDAALPTLALGLGALELLGEIGDLMVEILARLEAVIAGIGVEPEIAEGVKRKRRLMAARPDRRP
jgi:hypothetical protein